MQRFDVGGVAEFAKEMAEKGLPGKPKVSLQFELSASGITNLLKAEAALEETYMVEEEVEVDDDSEEGKSEDAAKDDKEADKKAEEGKTEEETKTEDGATEGEEKKPEKKKKTIKVEKVSAERKPQVP